MNKPFTYHPAATKANGGGFRPMIILRNSKGQCVGSKAARKIYADKNAARNEAREVAHIAVSRLCLDYPGFAVRVA